MIYIFLSVSVQFSHTVVSDSLWPHELQHAWPPCPSPTLRVYSNSCPSSRWCHPALTQIQGKQIRSVVVWILDSKVKRGGSRRDTARQWEASVICLWEQLLTPSAAMTYLASRVRTLLLLSESFIVCIQAPKVKKKKWVLGAGRVESGKLPRGSVMKYRRTWKKDERQIFRQQSWAKT